jgi:hypothetical protein
VSELYTRPSPSAISLHRLCEARAGARYVARLEDTQKKEKANLGSRCHAIAEEYLKNATAPNRYETFDVVTNGSAKTYYPGRIVYNILQHLPPAGSVPDVEQALILEWRGISFNGRMDWLTDVGVGDHKFTSSTKYALTPDELIHDDQRIIYCADWFQRHPDRDTMIAQWTYGQFDCKHSLVVKVPARRSKIFELLDEVVMPAAQKLLKNVADQVDWNTLPKNFAACEKYPPDGCPYSGQCKKTDKQRIRSVIMGSALLDRIRAAKGVNTNAVAPVVVAVVDDKTVASEVEHDAADAANMIAGAINPPGEAADVAIDEPTPIVAATVEAKKRGRPKKAEPVATVAKPVAPVTEPTADEIKAAEPQGNNLVLFVNCMPTKGFGALTSAADLIAQAKAHTAKEFEVPDYRLADYGKGQGFLAATLEALIAELPANTCIVLEDSSEFAIALQPFLAAATVVVRGF